ncbi:methyl-accepting chemotaxis protein [Bradyrhizobium japonicum]|uniref:methyl-accepting chemotaxis protein n=1 Tax=Bradyrhizobium japonicum TaxID=375 RepID=UPI00041E9215|nr:methyl-accepting chemotaxis protein [Bradyrhizobium japonicum]
MHARIGTILPLIVSALALMGVAATGFAALGAYRDRQEAHAFVELNAISQQLLHSAGQWALERGMTNAALNAPETITADRRAEIDRIRADSDRAFRDAAQRLRSLPVMKSAESRVAEAERVLQGIDSLRRKVDADLTRQKAERDPAVLGAIVPAMTELIEIAANRLRLTLETLTDSPSPAMTRLVGLRHLTAEMAENAGRERAFLAGLISGRTKLTADGIGQISGLRGHVDLAWTTISPVAQRADVSVGLGRAIKDVEQKYFDSYGSLRTDVIRDGNAGEYKISSNDYFAGATSGINAILQLGEAIAADADREAAGLASRSTSHLVVSGGVLLASIALALLSFWVAFSRILRPLSALTTAMGELAAGNFSIVLPGLGRKDEIGDMAHAVEAFKVKAEEKARLEVDEKVRQDQIAAEQRKADMHRLAGAFEAAIGEIVDTVSSASTELEASAGTLNTTAERAQELAVVVASASDEASSNVQSVASATEQLSSSVNEISRRVQDQARMANEAVGQAGQTNDRIGELSKAAARIGDVIELIDQIAGQTNLLALNATIEAARAGEAGRGFAVVASEVKALAEQTAKATGEISQHITGIQAATQDSVSAIREIGGSIAGLSEIASAIAAAVEEQGAATQEIARNVQLAAQGTQQVTANVGDVQRGATETGSASSQVLSAAQTLSRDSNRLKLEVGKFLETVRAA